MMKIDLKKRFREVKFTTEHTMTPEQRTALIMEKVNRAKFELERKSRSTNQLHA
jgi:hypothetical protein